MCVSSADRDGRGSERVAVAARRWVAVGGGGEGINRPRGGTGEVVIDGSSCRC